jgi:hypothetical protein
LPTGRLSGSRLVSRPGFGSEAWRRRPENRTFEALTRVRAGHVGSMVRRSICLCLREARSPGNGPPRAPPRLGGRPAPRLSRAGVHAVGPAGGAGVPQRRPGRASAQARARERATRPEEAASRTGPRSSTQSPITRRADRTEPIEPPPTPDPAFSFPSLLPIPRPPYPRLPPRRRDGRPAGLKSDTNPPIHLPLPRCRRPAPGPPAPAWANPPHVYLAGRGRGVRREAADPPSSKAQAQSGKQAGGGAGACCAQGRNP